MSKLFNTVVIVRSKNGDFKEPNFLRICMRSVILATGKDTISDTLKDDFVITNPRDDREGYTTFVGRYRLKQKGYEEIVSEDELREIIVNYVNNFLERHKIDATCEVRFYADGYTLDNHILYTIANIGRRYSDDDVLVPQLMQRLKESGYYAAG